MVIFNIWYFEYIIKEQGELDKIRIHNAEGYYTNGEYFYYRRDHLGNNREVWNATQNTTVQKNDYYPSGLPFEYITSQEQPYMYNGKEFVEFGGLDEYDSEARYYYPAIGRTTTMDAHAEKYYHISPYAWVANRFMVAIDPTGMDSTWYNSSGNIIYTSSKDPNTNSAFVIKTTQSTSKMYADVLYGTNNVTMGNSNPISAKDAQNSMNEVAKGNIVGDHMNNFVEIPNVQQGSFALDYGIGDNGDPDFATRDFNNREYAFNINVSTGETYGEVRGDVGDPSKNSTVSVEARQHHSHPSGVKNGSAWQQAPSNTDISNTSPSFNKYVWGMRSGIVYVYNSTGVIATISMKIYR